MRKLKGMNDFEQHLKDCHLLHVQQVFEGLELLGFETWNKYRILDQDSHPLAYAAEQKAGIGGMIMRQFLGHWRTFKVSIFNERKEEVYLLNFPFRWFFKTLFVSESKGRIIGRLEQRFAFFRKKFDVYDTRGNLVANINSSFFKFWTFEFFHHNQSLGKVQKKWSGVLSEMFTDKDNFVVTYSDPNLTADVKALMLATCLMVDIIYFEQKGKSSLLDFGD
jgi:uncharacterized protein YxjI